jgi:hypothetical protein
MATGCGATRCPCPEVRCTLYPAEAWGTVLSTATTQQSFGLEQDIPSAERQTGPWRPILATPVYIILLIIAVVVQSFLAPTWFVSSRTGLQAIVQSLPTALIALFALAFATLFVAVQQVTNVFSSRAPIILASDPRVRRIVARTVLITALSLILGAIIPDPSTPPKQLPSYMTAAGTTLLIASALLIYAYGRFALVLIIDYSAPRSFVAHVVNPVSDMVSRNKVKTGLILFRVPLLGQTLRYALRRDDAETFYASLEGLRIIQKLYVAATIKNPSLRNHRIAADNVREHWLSDELYRTYAGAGEEALRLQSPQHEIDLLVDYFGDATLTFVRAHQEYESKQMITGLARLTTSPYQVTSSVTNNLVRPASTLAGVERCAEQEILPELAAFALANWAVAIAYPQAHFGITYHPLFEEGVRRFGPHPPWMAAIELVHDPGWTQQWVNQLQARIDLLEEVLELARDLHEGPGGENYKLRKRVIYRDWLAITASVPIALATDPSGYTRRLDGISNRISMFASAAVKAAVSAYFANYGDASSRVTEALTSTQGDLQAAIRALSNIFAQGALAGTRSAVQAVMSDDLGGDLDENVPG